MLASREPPSLLAREPRALRGALRLLQSMGHATLTEFPLKTGRRADILSLDAKGCVAIVEVKSGLPDFRTDSKWPCYLEWCDTFYFAVDPKFPADALPAETGLIIADEHDGIVVTPAVQSPLASARRKALMLRFAQIAAARLARLNDPFPI